MQSDIPLPERPSSSGACAQALREVMRRSLLLTELAHERVHGRLVSLLLAGSILWDLIDPALLIVSVQHSAIHRVAQSTLGPSLVAIAFVALSTLLLPFLVVQLVPVERRLRRRASKVACMGLVGAAVLWIFLASTAMGGEWPALPWIYARTGLGALIFAFAIALSLNAEQLRVLMERGGGPPAGEGRAA